MKLKKKQVKLKQKLIHYKPLNGKVNFLIEDLENFIQKGRVKTQEEIEIEAQEYEMEVK